MYRRPGERYAPCNIVGTVQFGEGSVLVCGGILLEARTELVVIPGRALNAHGYVTTIVEPHVIPFAPFIGDQFVFMHDIARPHIAGIVRDYLEETNITTIVWPARSPDLNPIEHVWDMLGRRLRASDPRPNSFAEVRNRLVEIWENLDQKIWTKMSGRHQSQRWKYTLLNHKQGVASSYRYTGVKFYYNLLFFLISKIIFHDQ
jgi:transposase